MRKTLPITLMSTLAVAVPVGAAAVAQAAEVLPTTTTPTAEPVVSSSGGPTEAGVKRKIVAADVRAQELRPKPPPKPEPEPEPVAVPPHLEAIASCESGGDPGAVSPDGTYRGKYQFSMETWAAVGGSGDPAAAPEAEQDRLAQVLYETAGPGQWPVCGQ